MLVVASRRPGGHGGADLWLSTRTAAGEWSQPVDLGPPINTELYEFCPMGTADGRLFFFSRRIGATWAETTGGALLWMDAAALEEAR